MNSIWRRELRSGPRVDHGPQGLPSTTRARSCRGESGESGPLEAAILAPVFLGILYFVVAFGRVNATSADVTHAARSAARAAAAEQDSGLAVDAANRIVNDTLADRGVNCAELAVSVDTGSFGSGGSVTVTVGCLVDLSSAAGFPVPGSRRVTATAVEVLDVNRGGP
jgi:Flp pilus assembly protein TadG